MHAALLDLARPPGLGVIRFSAVEGSPLTVAESAQIAAAHGALWKRFSQQHGHDLEPLLDACSRMERGSRRDGAFSATSRAVWQAQQRPATGTTAALAQRKAH